MLIALAFSFIGVLLVFGNYKFLRNKVVLITTLIFTTILAVLGIFILTRSDPDNPYFLMITLSPLIALLLLQIVRTLFFRARGQEIILYLGGIIPRRFEERFVSRLEKLVTFLITVMALLLPYLIILAVEKVA